MLKTELPLTEINKIPFVLPYTNNALIYKADINFYKNNFGGLLIIKKTDKNIYRIALTTQFGLKIFDFELDHGILNVKYCVEYLNKKMILKTFQNDFNLLLIQNNITSIQTIKDSTNNRKIWQLKSGNISYNYIQGQELANIESISFMKRNSEKISVRLYNYKNDIPGNIDLKHRNIKLKMNLKLVQ